MEKQKRTHGVSLTILSQTWTGITVNLTLRKNHVIQMIRRKNFTVAVMMPRLRNVSGLRTKQQDTTLH